jgi:DNA-binding PadR family transcriptional regulator
MSTTYAGVFGLDWPWLRFSGKCGPTDSELSEWLAKMTRGHRGQWGHHPFAGWGPLGNPPPFGAPWARGPRAPKARRGDVRAAILAVLADAPRNGYQIIQEIAERSRGVWKPSPGSIYPTLQQLEDEGLVRAEENAGRRAYALTEEGRAYVAEHADEVAAPWEAMTEADSEDGIKPLIGQVAAAVWQIVAVGTAEQQARGREALIELRRKLYAILSEDDQAEERS